MSEDAVNFWKVASDDSVFWDAYVSTRPVYSQQFYNEIFDYHAQHSSTWKVAHDIGCGAGQLTAKLVPRFGHVVGSDCNDTHVAVAKRNLAKMNVNNVSWTVAKAEDMLHHHPTESSDLLVVAEVMPILDEAEALHSFHTLLRPGGTLAITFYGCPTFAEREYEQYQTTLADIMEYHWTQAFRPGGATIDADMQQLLGRAANNMVSWLDEVSFDPAHWNDVTRIKWNPHAQLSFFLENSIGVPPKRISNVRPDEEVREVTDPDWWANNWTIADLKRYFRVLYPAFERVVRPDDAYLRQMFDKLEAQMGGPTAVRKFTWPTVLLLATKK